MGIEIKVILVRVYLGTYIPNIQIWRSSSLAKAGHIHLMEYLIGIFGYGIIYTIQGSKIFKSEIVKRSLVIYARF
jgi:hypothetical protein